MKNLFIISSILFSIISFSQIRIGDKTITSNPDLTNSVSVLLEFGDTKDKGIILPYVETVPSGANNAKGGTFIFDVSSNSEYKIKVKNENTGWTDLSVQSGYSNAVETIVKNPQASPLADKADAKIVIGAESSSTDGILVLESVLNNRAMILPIVENYNSIKNPSPGMMAFLRSTIDSSKHRLIVFNGQKWSFWKP